MQEIFADYIKACRKNAGFTLDEAALDLNVSRRMLNYYESGGQRVPDNVAMSMARIYKNPGICYMWLYCTRCGHEILSELDEKSLAENVLSFIDSMAEVKANTGRLVRIGKDNRVDAGERSEFEQIKKRSLVPIIKNSFGILFAADNKKPLRAATQSGR